MVLLVVVNNGQNLAPWKERQPADLSLRNRPHRFLSDGGKWPRRVVEAGELEPDRPMGRPNRGGIQCKAEAAWSLLLAKGHVKKERGPLGKLEDLKCRLRLALRGGQRSPALFCGWPPNEHPPNHAVCGIGSGNFPASPYEQIRRHSF